MAGDSKKIDSNDTTRVLNPDTDLLKLDREKAKAENAILIIIRGTPQGSKFTLDRDELYLGRDKSADLIVSDPNISRRHAKISRSGSGHAIEDAGSRNGTFVNDDQLHGSRKLAKEDMIKVGSTILKYLPAGELETLFHARQTDAASIDKLTGVFNRNYFGDVLEAEFKRAKALHSHFSVIMLDIDHFKKINDTSGHNGGDYVLSQLGLLLKNAGLRERDMVGRWGGEEFLVILNDSDLEKAQDVAERLRKKIEEQAFVFDGKQIPVTASMGVASLKKDHHSTPDLIREADNALYDSKKAGRNRVTVSN